MENVNIGGLKYGFFGEDDTKTDYIIKGIITGGIIACIIQIISVVVT